MPTLKSKHQTRARPKSCKMSGRGHAAQVTARKPRKRAAGTGRVESKQTRIIDMLRVPNGATIEAMAQATGWQPHSVRGFLAGIIRKKLGFNLVSTATESGRVYRIIEARGTSAVADANPSRAE